METELDEIARGDNTFEHVLEDFYGDFEKTLERAQEHIGENKVALPVEESDLICEKCGRRMIIKTGRFGKFAACPGYPECKNTKPLDASGGVKKEKEAPEKTDLKCELCGLQQFPEMQVYEADSRGNRRVMPEMRRACCQGLWEKSHCFLQLFGLSEM